MRRRDRRRAARPDRARPPRRADEPAHLTDVGIERADGAPLDDETRAALLGSFDRDEAIAIERGVKPAGCRPACRAWASSTTCPSRARSSRTRRVLRADRAQRHSRPDAAFPGLGGGGVDVRIPQVGLLAGIRIIFTRHARRRRAPARCTATYQWPHNTLKRVALNVNGQTGIISPRARPARARQRVYRNPREHVTDRAGDRRHGRAAAGVVAGRRPGAGRDRERHLRRAAVYDCRSPTTTTT
jgi:hypothetical protein